jgi:hypothetical protein
MDDKSEDKSENKSDENKQREESTVETCGICIEPLIETGGIMNLPCKHRFHEGCIREWIVDKSNCPLCKAKFKQFEVVDCDGNPILSDQCMEDQLLEQMGLTRDDNDNIRRIGYVDVYDDDYDDY